MDLIDKRAYDPEIRFPLRCAKCQQSVLAGIWFAELVGTPFVCTRCIYRALVYGETIACVSRPAHATEGDGDHAAL